MIAGRVLGVIPARGGSKGISRKNTRAFLGRPLIAWTIDAARESGCFDRVVLSTDDPEICALAEQLGVECPFVRPPELATDDAPTAGAVQHVLVRLEQNGPPFDIVVVLEPTSPARRPFHIREALRLFDASGADTVASISRMPHHYVPPKALVLESDGQIRGIDGTHVARMTHRRQELAPYYSFDGLIFAARAELLRAPTPTVWGERVIGYVVDRRYAIDLDEPSDWEPAESRLRRVLREEGGN